MGNILLNAADAVAPQIVCKAGDILQRDRFATSSIQTTGKVYISNKFRPSTTVPSDDWVEIAPIVPGLVVLEFPVSWLTSDAEYAVCSYCEGNS
jgi:hypothetical protein